MDGSLCPTLPNGPLLGANEGQVAELVTPEDDELNGADGIVSQLFQPGLNLVHSCCQLFLRLIEVNFLLRAPYDLVEASFALLDHLHAVKYGREALFEILPLLGENLRHHLHVQNLDRLNERDAVLHWYILRLPECGQFLIGLHHVLRIAIQLTCLRLDLRTSAHWDGRWLSLASFSAERPIFSRDGGCARLLRCVIH